MYEKDGMKLHNSDCMEGMKQYPDNYFDLAIVDPPYGIGENGDKGKFRGKLAIAKDYHSFAGGDIDSPDLNYFLELKRVSKNVVIWGANHFVEKIPKSNSSCWVVWDKVNGETDFADCELAYTDFNTAVRKFEFTWNGMIQGDMKNKEFRIHPTQKPVKLYSWLLNNYCSPESKILDTHLGSASHAIAWHYFNKGGEFVGYELDEDYFEASLKRIEQETAQISMF